MYQVAIQTSAQGVAVCMEEGPLAGCLIGFAEQVQLRDAVLHPNGRLVGYCQALWGFEFIREDLDVKTTLSLSINGRFRFFKNSRTVFLSDAPLRAGDSFRTVHATASTGGMRVSVAR